MFLSREHVLMIMKNVLNRYFFCKFVPSLFNNKKTQKLYRKPSITLKVFQSTPYSKVQFKCLLKLAPKIVSSDHTLSPRNNYNNNNDQPAIRPLLPYNYCLMNNHNHINEDQGYLPTCPRISRRSIDLNLFFINWINNRKWKTRNRKIFFVARCFWADAVFNACFLFCPCM